jgi:hypothetical protein
MPIRSLYDSREILGAGVDRAWIEGGGDVDRVWKQIQVRVWGSRMIIVCIFV